MPSGTAVTADAAGAGTAHTHDYESAQGQKVISHRYPFLELLNVRSNSSPQMTVSSTGKLTVPDCPHFAIDPDRGATVHCFGTLEPIGVRRIFEQNYGFD